MISTATSKRIAAERNYRATMDAHWAATAADADAATLDALGQAARDAADALAEAEFAEFQAMTDPSYAPVAARRLVEQGDYLAFGQRLVTYVERRGGSSARCRSGAVVFRKAGTVGYVNAATKTAIHIDGTEFTGRTAYEAHQALVAYAKGL